MAPYKKAQLFLNPAANPRLDGPCAGCMTLLDPLTVITWVHDAGRIHMPLCAPCKERLRLALNVDWARFHDAEKYFSE